MCATQAWNSSGRLGHDPERHPAVLDAAELGALPRILARLLGLEPEPGLAVGEDVALAREPRRPEAVDHVRRAHPERHRLPHRDVQLVGRGDVELRVAELPPPLVPDDLDRRGRPRAGMALVWKMPRTVGTAMAARISAGNDRPDDLDRGVAVDLAAARGRPGLPRKRKMAYSSAPSTSTNTHERPLERGGLDVVADPGEVRDRPERGLRIVLRAARRPAPAAERGTGGPPAQLPEAAVRRALRSHPVGEELAHTAGESLAAAVYGFRLRKVKELLLPAQSLQWMTRSNGTAPSTG